jgi:hypothetical protein
MASLQKSHEERAQSAAEKAADELAAAHASPRGSGILSSVKDTFSDGGGGRGDTTTAAGHDNSGTAADYAEEGKANTGGMADAAMDKAAETKDLAADRARGMRDAAANKDEGAKEYAAEKTAGAESEEDVMLRVKEADHMTGQAVNDVGPIGEEGNGMPRRRR